MVPRCPGCFCTVRLYWWFTLTSYFFRYYMLLRMAPAEITMTLFQKSCFIVFWSSYQIAGRIGSKFHCCKFHCCKFLTSVECFFLVPHGSTTWSEKGEATSELHFSYLAFQEQNKIWALLSELSDHLFQSHLVLTNAHLRRMSFDPNIVVSPHQLKYIVLGGSCPKRYLFQLVLLKPDIWF